MSHTRIFGHVLLISVLAACGDEEVGSQKDAIDILETTSSTDTAVTTTTTAPDTQTPQDTTVTETVADTTVTETVADTTVVETVEDTTVADTTVAETVADTAVAETVADTTVADTTSPVDTTPGDTVVGPQTCPTAETVVTTSTVFTGRDFSGALDEVKFTTDLCSDPPDSVERTYRFDLTSPTEIYAETNCEFDCELVLTKDGCEQNNVVDCASSIGDEIYAGVLGAGTYRFFIEGDNPEDPEAYELMLNFNHTGGQATCDATNIDAMNSANCEDPFIGDPRYELHLDSEATTFADVDDFFIQDVGGCSKDDSHVGGAPDKVYAFTLSGEREVSITLAPDGWDAMLAISRAPCGAASAIQYCSDDLIGGDETIEETLGAGTWYIVVDGFGEETFSGGAHGPFELEVLVYDDACDE